jgi:asparagine synthase (glutamine-hydrolysing)
MRGTELNALFLPDQLGAGAANAVPDAWRELTPEMHACDELGRLQVLEIRSSLPDELLMYADKLSMAHGLEVRVPYLDREVVEFVERLPAALKVRFGQRKWLHKRVCRRLLPTEILRRKKRGFGVNVVDEWFRGSLTRNLNSYLRDESSLMYGFLRSRAVRTLLDDHQAGRRDNHKILFSLVVFEEWLRNSESAWRNRSRMIKHIPASVGV